MSKFSRVSLVPTSTFTLSLELNQKEIEALAAVCRRIAGNPLLTERYLFDDILEVVKPYVNHWERGLLKGEIIFQSTKDSDR